LSAAAAAAVLAAVEAGVVGGGRAGLWSRKGKVVGRCGGVVVVL
jgi:hypothetical protein